MKDNAMSVDIEKLMLHADWVNRVARSLVYDRGLADDVAQETWLAALEGRPHEIQNPRGWLGGVVRNISKGLLRSRSRQQTRDRAAAKPEAAPDPEDVTERAALQRKVADLVIELEEPFRSTLLLRFFDGLSPREIARKMDVPQDTVHSRQHRALTQLRKKLDREFGNRETWGTLLLPLAHLVRLETAVPVLMKGAIAAALLIAGYGSFLAVSDSPSSATEVATSVENLPPKSSEPITSEAPGAREKIAEAHIASVGASEEAEPGILLRGRVLDSSGAPISGIRMGWFNKELWQFMVHVGISKVEGDMPLGGFEKAGFSWQASDSAFSMTREERENDPWKFIGLGEPLEVTSGQDGRFELRIPKLEGEIGPLLPDYILLAGKKSEEEPGAGEHLRIVAPSARVSGVVVDEQGNPIRGAWVRCPFPQAAEMSLPNEILNRIGILDGWLRQENSDHTDDMGRFFLAGVPNLKSTRVLASKSGEGFEDYEGLLSGMNPIGATIVLKKRAPTPELCQIEGIVLDDLGLPVSDARIVFGQWSGSSNAEGRFQFGIDQKLSPHYDSTALTAYREDKEKEDKEEGRRQVVILESFGKELRLDPARGRGLTLRLEALLSIAGRVIGPSGKPEAGMDVAVDDPTFLGSSSQTIESGVIGHSVGTTTNSRGEFVLPALRKKSYRLRVLGPDLSFIHVTEPIEAGTEGALIRVPEDAQRVVRVRLVSREGRPLPGVSATFVLQVSNSQGAARLASTYTQRLMATSGPDGRFVIERFPRRGGYLRFVSADTIQTRYEIAPDAPAEGIEIKLPLRCPMKVVLSEEAKAYRELRILDFQGNALDFVVLGSGGSYSIANRIPIDGDSVVIEAPDDGAALVLFENFKEVKRMPINPEPGKMQTVRF